jgi:hypothetical protein
VLAMAGLSWCWKARSERRSGFAELVVASAMRAASREILDVLIAVVYCIALVATHICARITTSTGHAYSDRDLLENDDICYDRR